MSLPRFYVEAALALGARVPLSEAVSRHALGALRLKQDAEVVLFNGDGSEYAGVLEVRGNVAWVECRGRESPERESPLEIWLVQGISAGDRMDYTIQKAVELGVAGIVPLTMRRSVVRLGGERAEKRRRHWQGIVVSACEQCGRNRVPEVAPITRFDDWLGQARAIKGTKLLLDPDGERLAERAKPSGKVWLLAGPEGGFDPDEWQNARAVGFESLRLGPRILRTETAGLAALAAMQTSWGDF